MSHQFSQVPKAEIPRSQFNRSHGLKTTFDSGLLIPIFVDEALPGDTFSLNSNFFGRLSTPIFPFMDNMFLESFFFAVPYRLVWDNWQKFNGEQTDPDDSTDYVIPKITSDGATSYFEGSIYDYLGLPINTSGYTHSALWNRAYNLIWNEWFRDQNLQDSVPVPTGNTGTGGEGPTMYDVLRRGRRHDYFTSCLPWPQKGPAVTIPLGTSAPVITNNEVPRFVPTSGTNFSNDHLYWDNANGYFRAENTTGPSGSNPVKFGTESGLIADLDDATGATINSLRQAFQIQKMYERDARGGTRYTEIIRAHFGVTSPDARLQRPEYLGGGSTRINVNPVAQTAPTSMVSPQGNLAAFGTMSASGHGFTKGFTEHCLIIGLVSVRADLTYQYGLERMWSRSTRFDFYWPALSHIGEQAVLNKEIFCTGVAGTDVGEDDYVFGYQERYGEYRYKTSKTTGLMRSNATGSIDQWHLADEMTEPPLLDGNYIQDNPPVDRVLATGNTAPEILFDAYFDMKCARPMPTYGVPGFIDRF